MAIWNCPICGDHQVDLDWHIERVEDHMVDWHGLTEREAWMSYEELKQEGKV